MILKHGSFFQKHLKYDDSNSNFRYSSKNDITINVIFEAISAAEIQLFRLDGISLQYQLYLAIAKKQFKCECH